MPLTPWTYRGISIHPMDPNSMGLQWMTFSIAKHGPLRAETKADMRELIRQHLKH